MHVKRKCFGPYYRKYLFHFHGAKSARDKTSIDVCMSISGMECAKDLLYNDYRQAFRESFQRNNFYPERSAISCSVAMALCCHSQFLTAPEDKGAVVFQLSQNEPQWLIKSRYDLL